MWINVKLQKAKKNKLGLFKINFSYKILCYSYGK